MGGCFCPRGLVCIDESDEMEKRKRGGEQMGAAGFDQRYRMRQLCSRECEIAHEPVKCVSGCESKIPPKTFCNLYKYGSQG